MKWGAIYEVPSGGVTIEFLRDLFGPGTEFFLDRGEYDSSRDIVPGGAMLRVRTFKEPDRLHVPLPIVREAEVYPSRSFADAIDTVDRRRRPTL